MEEIKNELEDPGITWNINTEYTKTIFELLHRSQIMYSRGDLGAHFHSLKVVYEFVVFKLSKDIVEKFDKDT